MSNPLRIAVADDEPLMRMYFEEMLPELGYEVVSAAENGAELVQQVHIHHPDSIVTDIRMPGVDGVQAVHEICEEEPMPVVFISGQDRDAKDSRTADECIYVHLTKPVGQEEIRDAIETVMEKYHEFATLRIQEPDQHRALALLPELEVAKSDIMRRKRLSRAEAFEHLIRFAKRRHLSLVEASRDFLRRSMSKGRKRT